jgi:hypothetical protein
MTADHRQTEMSVEQHIRKDEDQPKENKYSCGLQNTAVSTPVCITASFVEFLT